MADFSEPLKLNGIHHVGIVVDDLAAVEAFLEGALGLRKVAATERDDLMASFFDCSGTQIELIQIIDVKARAERLGDAKARMEHIAVTVDDLDEAVATLAKLDVETTGVRISSGRRTTWTRPETSYGMRYQLLELSGSDPPGDFR